MFYKRLFFLRWIIVCCNLFYQNLKDLSNYVVCLEQLHPEIQTFAQQREIKSIEYAMAGLDVALKYNIGLFSEYETNLSFWNHTYFYK